MCVYTGQDGSLPYLNPTTLADSSSTYDRHDLYSPPHTHTTAAYHTYLKSELLIAEVHTWGHSVNILTIPQESEPDKKTEKTGSK